MNYNELRKNDLVTEETPKLHRNFPAWFRPIAFIVVETFLWTTLSTDIALAFDHHQENHLRPKSSAAEGGVKDELLKEFNAKSDSAETKVAINLPMPVTTPSTVTQTTVTPTPVSPNELPSAADGGRKALIRNVAEADFRRLKQEFSDRSAFQDYLQGSNAPLEHRLADLAGASADEINAKHKILVQRQEIVTAIERLIEEKFNEE